MNLDNKDNITVGQRDPTDAERIAFEKNIREKFEGVQSIASLLGFASPITSGSCRCHCRDSGNDNFDPGSNLLTTLAIASML